MSRSTKVQRALLILFVGMTILCTSLIPRENTFAAGESAPINYAKDILPIFQAHCAKCHLNGERKGVLDLASQDNLLKGGESQDPAVVPHDSAASRLMLLLTSDDPDMVMPKEAKRLSDSQIALIKQWIDRGAPWGDLAPTAAKYVAPLEPRRPPLPDGTAGNPIDRMLIPYFAQHPVPTSALVDDRLYARRVYLDTIGLLPTPTQIDEFVSDSRANKRARLVEQLLADKGGYAEHWMSFWNDALRNDYKGTGYIDGGRKQITGWLYGALFNNMPYDQFVAGLINPKSESEGFINGFVWRGAVSASQGREIQAAQNVTQVFLGLNFKCNSCHDSFISEWKLADAYGLAGVFADVPLEMSRCEKPTGKTAPVTFMYPQLGAIDGDAPRAAKMKQLADLMTAKGNGRLSRTIVNRLWARFFGRGIIEPVDEMDRQPWNADLLDWLASDLADHGYDLKRTIALMLTSRAYQMRAVGMREQTENDFTFAGPVVRRMSAEQFCDATSQLTGRWNARPVPGDALALPQFALPAKWIWNRASAREQAPLETIELRREFELTEKPTEALLAAVADNNYVLYLNGKKVTYGKDFNKPQAIDLMPFLVDGKNRIEVWASNEPTPSEPGPATTQAVALTVAGGQLSVSSGQLSVASGQNGTQKERGLDPKPASKPATSAENPAGFWMLASIRTAGGNLIEIPSDGAWETRAGNSDVWKPAIELGDTPVSPWNLTKSLGGLRKPFTLRKGRVRSVWVNNDVLMTALGRPNREQVVTNRISPATMLQMLEMTNGRMLSEIVQSGAKRWMNEKCESTDAMVWQIYREGLGRAPSDAELALSIELLKSSGKEEGIEDLLWTILMLPEFQLIY